MSPLIRGEGERDEVLCTLIRAQAQTVPAYGRLLQARGVDVASLRDPGDAPALPTDVFRFTRVASFPEAEDVRVFRTSGTTHGERGVHAFRDLSLYDAAAEAAARHALFHDVDRIRIVSLVPSETEAPDSSLSYMVARFGEWFGDGPIRYVFHDGRLDLDALDDCLDDVPVALLGTSFAFVHADDGLGDRRYALAEGSRIMQTGGFKGRSRQLEPAQMRVALASRFGIDEHRIIAEYGMTELSSQLYETCLRRPDEPRRLEAPGWVRASVVDPETLRPVPPGAIGILRVDDAANVDSVCAIQTSDLAREIDGGIEVLGRAEDAVPRGCSLAIEEALDGDTAR